MSKYKVFFIQANKAGRPVERSRTLKARSEGEAVSRVSHKATGRNFYAIKIKETL